MKRLQTLHLFAGAGGGIIADMLLGHRPVGAVEINKHCRRVLHQRQQDGWLPKFPIYKDIKEFQGNEIQKRVDVISGGFPCQDISSAGKGAGIYGKQSGLFFELARVCRRVRPRYIFLENSPAITARGLGTVLGELSEMGYDAEWCCISAADVGAPHGRDRWWCLCRNTKNGGGVGQDEVPDAQGIGCEQAWRITERPAKKWFLSRSIHAHLPLTGTEQVYQVTQKDHQAEGSGGADATPSRNENKWWQAEPRLGRVAYGVADRVDRLKAIGNGQVPAAAVAAWIILWNRLHTEDWSSR